jgi:lipopolysaccharide/colanic/teichoic acid biosynthesis glycosyltransferase
MKRIIDIVASGVGLLFLLPVMSALIIWIRLDSPGSAFYKQQRVGKEGRVFWLFKFRSMAHRAGGPEVTLGNSDYRITAAGKWLRRTKLDELPQLWNVLIGDMSIVGPRPEVPRYVEKYSEVMKRVLSVRPGLTDPASLHGFDEGAILDAADDPENHYLEVIMPQKVAMQLDYIDKANTLSDLTLVARTLLRVFKGG